MNIFLDRDTSENVYEMAETQQILLSADECWIKIDFYIRFFENFIIVANLRKNLCNRIF